MWQIYTTNYGPAYSRNSLVKRVGRAFWSLDQKWVFGGQTQMVLSEHSGFLLIRQYNGKHNKDHQRMMVDMTFMIV